MHETAEVAEESQRAVIESGPTERSHKKAQKAQERQIPFEHFAHLCGKKKSLMEQVKGERGREIVPELFFKLFSASSLRSAYFWLR